MLIFFLIIVKSNEWYIDRSVYLEIVFILNEVFSLLKEWSKNTQAVN